ncbi:carbamoyl-phosphate synthase large subunit [bacterium]|nr:carbamoyl-phosphate synthase large subunit [bacterium]MBU1753624.1 carbamoyl-phosphate synthase large subunit [bacterium]
MPKRTDINKILIIGSGPIIISQACEFDYSGTQACKALREDGYFVILVNSNPATIMTDPQTADRTYIEPITPEVVAKIIEIERPDAILPTLGGQTGLNTAIKLFEMGVLDKYHVEMIGANYSAIRKAEDRSQFKEAMIRIGLDVPKSGLAYNMDDSRRIAKELGFPLIIRASLTLGGTGGGIAYNIEEFEQIVAMGLEASPISEILIEESIIGWKEYELEVMRDIKDNVVIICSIENLDPMGVHTGDSITVAPAQTLSDREYQLMRDAAIKVIREIGVETGGSNVQFALNPENGRMVVIEINPRVSRSSALASKATGFPIAKMAAKLAVGYTLDEIPNDITRETPASFEPTIDYCVIKIPRFTFEKFLGAEDVLGISMKSVGEAMAIGRTFKEALQKGLRSLEIGRFGLGGDGKDIPKDMSEIKRKISIPNSLRIFYLREAFLAGMSMDEIFEITKIDRWFLHNIEQIVNCELRIADYKLRIANCESRISKELLREAKEYGFSDRQLAYLLDSDEESIRNLRKGYGIEATFKLVDTCAAEFEAYTPYYYSTYETEDETRSGSKKKVMILGGGPNRIGQGIEFDYCCCQASFALREEGYESIMVNCNPETVSTDYDTSDRLYFEPMTREDILNIVDREKPEGVIIQLGGQTPLNLAIPLEKAGVKILGTSTDAVDRAEDRERFKLLLQKLGLKQSPNGTAVVIEEARRIAKDIGYPVIVRPSYVLGGRAMEIVYDDADLEKYMKNAVFVSPDRPVLVDKFLEDAIEVDVDAISDGNVVIIGGIMEHIEFAGVHSGDSACVLPPHTLSPSIIQGIKENTYALAMELGVIGLLNIQYAIQGNDIFVLEVNPRASRTVPFVSKVIGVSLAKLAAKVMLGKTLKELGFDKEIVPQHVAVKEAVFPFARFSGVDPVLGPEMKSTGEVMGIDTSFGRAFAKSQIAAGQHLPVKGTIFISVKDKDKPIILPAVQQFVELGFRLIGTEGTARYYNEQGIPMDRIFKVGEGRPDIVDMIKNNEIALLINTPSGKKPRTDEVTIRSHAYLHGIPIITIAQGVLAAVDGIAALIKGSLQTKCIQEYHIICTPEEIMEAC